MNRVVQHEVELGAGGQPDDRRERFGDSRRGLVHLRLRVARQQRRLRVVRAGFADQRVARVVEAHVEPRAAAFGIAGRQLVARSVRHAYAQRVALLRQRQRRRELQHVPRADDAGVERGHVDARRNLAQQRRNPRAAAGHVVQRQVGAHGRILEVAGLPRDRTHVAVLALGDVLSIAAEFRRENALRRVEGAMHPLAVRALDGAKLMRAERLGRLVECVGADGAVGVSREDRVAHVVAYAADRRRAMQRRIRRLVRRDGVVERPAQPPRVRVDDVLPAGITGGHVGKVGQNFRVERRADAFNVDRIDLPVAEVAAHANEVVGLHLRAVRRRRAARQPAAAVVAAQAHVAGLRRVGVGDLHEPEKQRIDGSMGHHAAAPVECRLDAWVVIAVAAAADLRADERLGAKWLRAGHVEIAQRRRHAPAAG